jgi:hypothetical protein
LDGSTPFGGKTTPAPGESFSIRVATFAVARINSVAGRIALQATPFNRLIHEIWLIERSLL